jgi:hypothetical protein
MSDNTNKNNMNGAVPKAKTRMCNNLTKGQCPYGKKCHFAHDVSELQVQNCGFGDKCVFVISENGNVSNSPNSCKVCRFFHPGETEAGYSRRIYNSMRTVVAVPRQTNISPMKLDLSTKKAIEADVWYDVQSKKTTVAQPQVQAAVAKKSVNSFSAIDNRYEHIVAKVNAENLFERLDEWGDEEVKDISLTVVYPGANVFEPNIGFYEGVKVKNF